MRDLYISSYTQTLEKHNAILQTLNRKIGGVLFPLEPFADAAQAWDGKRVIYAKTHPDMDALIQNFDEEIKRIGGRDVGAVKNPRVEMTGHPRLMADVEISDEETNAGIAAGKISLSTGFYATGDEHQILGNVLPNHVLVFDESLYDQPRDQGAGFLNKFLNKDDNANRICIHKIPRGNMTEQNEEQKPLLTAEEIKNMKPIDAATYLQKITEFENKFKEMEAVSRERYNTNRELEAKLEKFAQMEQDQKWSRLEKKLPIGLVRGEEVKKTKAWLNSDPAGLIEHIIDIMSRDNKTALEEQGRMYLNNVNARTQKQNSDLCSGVYLDGEEVPK